MPEESFRKLPGVLDTVVGYTGGTTPFPTYQSIGDHTEALRVTFDPGQCSYEALLRKFWAEHQPMPMAFSGTQYRSAVFAHSPEQRATAIAVREELEGNSPFASNLDLTAIEDGATFFRAEEYHQQFLFKQMSPSERY